MELGKLGNVLPSPDLSIDILSLINTNYESDADGSSDGFEGVGLKESGDREGKGDEDEELNTFMRWSPEERFKHRFPSARTQYDFDDDVFIVPDDIYSEKDAVSFEKENFGNCFPCNHYNSSFYEYLNSLSCEKDLHKYFRPCHACKKTYCVCLDSLASDKVPGVSFDSTKRLLPEEDKNKNLFGRQAVSTMNFMKMNKAVGTDVNITKFDGCEYKSYLSFRKGSFECSDLERRRCGSCRNGKTNFPQSRNERKRSFCCETLFCEHSARGDPDSGIDTKASFESLREPCLDDDSNRIFTWAPFLENAARNARNLVRDLELIMKSCKSESN